MSEQKRISLEQALATDHTAQVMREKIGDISELDSLAPAIPTEITGFDSPDQKDLLKQILVRLRSVFDPEIPLNIYDLGLIYKLRCAPTNAINIEMTLTAPGCPVAGTILREVKHRVQEIPEIPQVDVELVWDPPWSRERLSDAARLTLGMM